MTAITIASPMPGIAPKHGHADEADHRQPELPLLDAIDTPQVGDLDQADRRGDDDGGQGGCGRC